MGSPYSQDLRDRILAAYDRGMKTKQIADLFQVSRAWARRVKQRRRETGETSARPMGGVTVIKVDVDRLTELVKKHPDATIKELHALLRADCSESAVCMALRRLGLTLKKRRSARPSKTGPTSQPKDAVGRKSNRRSTPNV